MTIDFYKYDGAGNDFVLVDVRAKDMKLAETEIARICHRRFGVGADGLMTLGSADAPYDFEMKYYNSDGRIGSMCGNGGRCIAAFAHRLGLGHHDPVSDRWVVDFLGFDGPHHAEMIAYDNATDKGVVQLGMRDVPCSEVRKCLEGCFLDTGSPHYVQQVSDLSHYDVVGRGRSLRNNSEEFPEGTNVDFIELMDDGQLFVRTYERGVEDETWACGTGVTACAIVSGVRQLKTLGGDFCVDYELKDGAYRNVRLTGPVSLNFVGKWNC